MKKMMVFIATLNVGLAHSHDAHKEGFHSPNRGAVTGQITAGGALFDYQNFTQTEGALNDFAAGGADNMFSTWWYYRANADTQEFKFPEPNSADYSGDTATLNWTDVDGRNLFSAELTHVIAEPVANAATLSTTMTITNISGSELDIDLFSYTDFDAADSAGNDEATLVSDPEYIAVVDNGGTAPSNAAEVRAGGANSYQVLAWPGLRTLFFDTEVLNLDNTGLPFAPADYTGAHQWTTVTIPVDGTFTVQVNSATGDTTATTPLNPVIFDPADVIFKNGFEPILF